MYFDFFMFSAGARTAFRLKPPKTRPGPLENGSDPAIHARPQLLEGEVVENDTKIENFQKIEKIAQKRLEDDFTDMLGLPKID